MKLNPKKKIQNIYFANVLYVSQSFQSNTRTSADKINTEQDSPPNQIK